MNNLVSLTKEELTEVNGGGTGKVVVEVVKDVVKGALGSALFEGAKNAWNQRGRTDTGGLWNNSNGRY
ncbi:hypothetical protein G9F71_002215 [Clostridium sp. FP2]|uniref:hypothetical protein n=1 Tax=Clostridium sp. FP2 TaxID=2724481 RepID=UPI001A9C219E|nr:hypothetical protein [Clostridium sp. FP2]MBZ9621682.1 hypothetical protein [Clostridium sp. FP2]